VRVNGFVSGGAVPAAMQGTRLDGLVALWDWYATLAQGVGGLQDITDHRAAAADLPPIDSINVWPYLTGAQPHSPRRTLELGASSCVVPSDGCVNLGGESPSRTLVTGILVDEGDGGLWKLLVGSVPMNGWQGPSFPNASTSGWAAEKSIHDCGETGCLFELRSDPTEHVDLAASEVARVQALLERLREGNATTFSPDRGAPDTAAACEAAMVQYGGFWGPWLV
jgi:arylsulfatase I/J